MDLISLPFYRLHKRKRIDFDEASFPGLETSAVRVPLQATFEMVGLEVPERGARRFDAARTRGQVVHLDGELLQMVHASVHLLHEQQEFGWGQE